MMYSSTLFVCALFVCAASQQTGDVRLADGTDTKGRLEVYHAADIGNESRWVNICFNETAYPAGMAQAVCRQLGYMDYTAVGNVTTLKLPTGNASEGSKFFGGRCEYVTKPEEAPQHILRCFLDLPLAKCNNSDNMAVECKGELRKDMPYDTMVDIRSESMVPKNQSISEGFAFSYINDKWGPVCNMNHADADSFCRQLSFTNAKSVEEREPAEPEPLEKEVLDVFECLDTSYSCLRKCYPYPSTKQEIKCVGGFSYVTCNFETDFEDEFFEEYGTKSKCTQTVHNDSVAGVVVGVLLVITTIAIIAVVVVCFFMPGCYLARLRQGASPLRSEPKYDSI